MEIDRSVIEPPAVTMLNSLGYAAEDGELVQDYASRYVDGRKLQQRSPYAKFYKIKNTGQRVMIAGILPRATPDDKKIIPAWKEIPAGFQSDINLFSAEVTTAGVQLICLYDQPTGIKRNELVEYNPVLTLKGKSIAPSHETPTLLAVDPINPNMSWNVLEWDLGICKRWLRIIQGRIHGYWVFSENPQGEVRIDYNQTGDYRLKLGNYKVSLDEELIPATIFDETAYPFIVSDSATYYPDPDAETSSVDGYARAGTDKVSWTNEVGAAGAAAVDNDTDGLTVFIKSSDVADTWIQLYRGFLLFDTSGLPDAATIGVVTLSVKGTNKADNLSITPDINVYSSDPFSNTALQADDFVDVGSTAFSTAITYAAFNTAGYNDFVLNDAGKAVDTQLNRQGVSKYSLRNANYDVAEELDPGNHAPAWTGDWVFSGFYIYWADQGNTTSDPKLVVTYTVPGGRGWAQK